MRKLTTQRIKAAHFARLIDSSFTSVTEALGNEAEVRALFVIAQHAFEAAQRRLSALLPPEHQLR